MEEYCVSENKKLSPGDIPGDTKILIFCYDFNQPLEVGSIPRGVKSIKFGSHFNQKLEIGVIPYLKNSKRIFVYFPIEK